MNELDSNNDSEPPDNASSFLISRQYQKFKYSSLFVFVAVTVIR